MGIALNHLTESERERIAKTLFEVSSGPDAKGELHGLCPIHGEKNPSFSYNIRTDLYNCFSCGASGDLVTLWAFVHGITDQKEGFKAFCKEFEISLESKKGERPPAPEKHPGCDDESEPPGDLERVWEMFPPLPEDRIIQLEATRGWNRRTIEILDLRHQTYFCEKKSGKLKPLKSGGGIAIPIRDSKGRLANIRIYKPGDKKYKIVSWAAGTGEARLFPPAPFSAGQPILLCEGESDCICAISHGFNAITQTTKPKTWKARQLEIFRGREVVIAYDADKPGQKYMGFAAKALEGIAKSIRILTWPDFMGRTAEGTWPEDHGEDLTDFFVKHGKKPSDLSDLMNNARLHQDDVASSLGVLAFFERGAGSDRLSFRPRLLAKRILEEHSLLYESTTGLLYRWNGRIWKLYNEDLIAERCLDLMENEAQKSRTEDALYQIKKKCAMRDDRAINDRQDWVCVSNGLLNLRTLELVPHDKDYLCTFFLPVEYNPDSSKSCERFLQYLEETIQDPELIAQLQEFAGYCLTHSTQFEKCLLLIGPGADGKSTFLKILRELVGPENCASVSFNDLDDQFQRSSLYGKLLNISTEVGNKAIESPYFKAITSGDPLNAAFKHKNTFTFSPTCKLAFAANRPPRSEDKSDGYFRRLLPIEFQRQFLEDADTQLFDKLKAEISEIFHWALVGLHRLWDQDGFTRSAKTRQFIMQYRRNNNNVLCFVEDELIVSETSEVAKKDLYNRYRAYCGENGFSASSSENFFRELYLAVANIKQYRPRLNGVRENMIRGIKFNE